MKKGTGSVGVQRHYSGTAGRAASDELYRDNGAFRAGVAKLGLGYVLAGSRLKAPCHLLKQVFQQYMRLVIR